LKILFKVFDGLNFSFRKVEVKCCME